MEKVAISLERIDLDYNGEVDVLYISFGKPREAKDSVEVEDGGIYGLPDKIPIMELSFNWPSNGLSVSCL